MGRPDGSLDENSSIEGDDVDGMDGSFDVIGIEGVSEGAGLGELEGSVSVINLEEGAGVG